MESAPTFLPYEALRCGAPFLLVRGALRLEKTVKEGILVLEIP